MSACALTVEGKKRLFRVPSAIDLGAHFQLTLAGAKTNSRLKRTTSRIDLEKFASDDPTIRWSICAIATSGRRDRLT